MPDADDKTLVTTLCEEDTGHLNDTINQNDEPASDNTAASHDTDLSRKQSFFRTMLGGKLSRRKHRSSSFRPVTITYSYQSCHRLAQHLTVAESWPKKQLSSSPSFPAVLKPMLRRRTPSAERKMDRRTVESPLHSKNGGVCQTIPVTAKVLKKAARGHWFTYAITLVGLWSMMFLDAREYSQWTRLPKYTCRSVKVFLRPR